MSKRKYYIVKLESYSGEYSSLQCDSGGNDADSMYCICLVLDDHAEIIDYGYNSLEQAKSAWPEAIG
jgi:hypothetical protein